jgi:hypothetical protein
MDYLEIWEGVISELLLPEIRRRSRLEEKEKHFPIVPFNDSPFLLFVTTHNTVLLLDSA